MRRREFITLLGGAATVWPLAARAQQAVKLTRIGFLGYSNPESIASYVDALRAGLRDLCYIEGKNIAIEHRWPEQNDRLIDVARELVRLNVDLIVTWGTPGTRAAKQATTTVPIVMAISGDAVATGIVASLAQPGGNVTGSTIFNPELCAKRLEILKELLPSTERVGILLNPDNPVSGNNLDAVKLTAASLKLELRVFEARRPTDLDRVFSALATRPVDAITVFEDPMLFTKNSEIVDAVLKQLLPTVGYLDLAVAGGLIAYGVNFPETFRHAALFVDKILKGAKPSEIPVEQATNFKLVLNLKTAKALGLAIPPMVLARADEVIE
jgi:putative ABC transport system substrate-binding protein